MNDLALLEPAHPVGFPATYLAARNALARCELVDECKEMADKAAAIEVYARQSKDDTLVIMAQRIQARAIRRMGELLKTIPHLHGPGCGEKGPTRTGVARAAGVTRVQQRQAAQIAQIPAKQFERAIESKRPPRPYKLAALGVCKRTMQTEVSLRRSLALAEEQLIRCHVRLTKAIEKVARLRTRLAAIEESSR